MWMDSKLNTLFNVMYKVIKINYTNKAHCFCYNGTLLAVNLWGFNLIYNANFMNVTFKCDGVSMKIYLD